MRPIPLSIAQSIVTCYENITTGVQDVSQLFKDTYTVNNIVVKRTIAITPVKLGANTHVKFKITETFPTNVTIPIDLFNVTNIELTQDAMLKVDVDDCSYLMGIDDAEPEPMHIYTAGEGIEITSENVINNTAPGEIYTAGAGISIENNVITNTAPGEGGGISYIAGEGISIENNVISNTSPGVEYTAGSGISIDNGVITNTSPNETELPSYSVADDDKILGVTLDDSGGITVAELNWIAKPTFTQAQADWSQTTTTEPDYIRNKPTIPSAPVQSNWNEVDTTSLAYIQNKPTVPSGNELVPFISSGDAGKVLTVNAGETATEWTTPSGGGNTTKRELYTDGNSAYYWDNDPDAAENPGTFAFTTYGSTGTQLLYDDGGNVIGIGMFGDTSGGPAVIFVYNEPVYAVESIQTIT